MNAKPPIQRLADQGLGLLCLWHPGGGRAHLWAGGLPARPAAQALLTAVAVLVVACPCALGLATPLALAIDLGRTSREGILVRNPVALETAATVRRIVLDKTGTLTQGRCR